MSTTTETPKTYNGWTNYETWNYALWMDNDEGSYRHGQSLAQSAWDDAEADRTFTRLERATMDLADTLKEQEEENRPDLPGVYSDLLGAAVSEINWQEIAENMLDSVDKDDEPETCPTCSNELDDDGECESCNADDVTE